MRERYTPGYTANATSFMASRTAAAHAAFALPFLWRGMRLLDCGCGAGAITRGLAARIAPGAAIGVDVAKEQIAAAETEKTPGARFQTASAYQLPFPDDTFDGAFSHALFEHLADPAKALIEIRRVVRPGGWIGLKSPDFGGFLLSPSSAQAEAALRFYDDLHKANGGDLSIGRRLGTLAREAGLRRIRVGAELECYESSERIAEYLAQRMELEPQGLAHAEVLRAWSREPLALFAQAWFSMVGEVPQ